MPILKWLSTTFSPILNSELWEFFCEVGGCLLASPLSHHCSGLVVCLGYCQESGKHSPELQPPQRWYSSILARNTHLSLSSTGFPCNVAPSTFCLLVFFIVGAHILWESKDISNQQFKEQREVWLPFKNKQKEPPKQNKNKVMKITPLNNANVHTRSLPVDHTQQFKLVWQQSQSSQPEQTGDDRTFA